MKIIKNLTGARFISLMSEGDRTNELIKKGGKALLKQSSPQQEFYYSEPAFKQVTPNPISVGFLCVLFITMYVLGLSILFNSFELSPPTFVSLFFPSILILAFPIASIPLLIGRGSVYGLKVILCIYLIGFFVTIISVALPLLETLELKQLRENTGLTFIQLIVIYLTRRTINSESLFKLVSHFRLKEISREAYKTRLAISNRK